jgi:hypothetical protein
MHEQNSDFGSMTRRLGRLLFRSDLKRHPIREIYRRICVAAQVAGFKRALAGARAEGLPLFLANSGAAAANLFSGATARTRPAIFSGIWDTSCTNLAMPA